MRARRVLGGAAAMCLLLGAAACGDDDDEAVDTTTTTAAAEGPAAIEVTLTDTGIDGVPAEVPAGVVEVTLVNETDGFAALDFSRVEAGTTEDDFVEGIAPVFEGGEFPDFFESNAGMQAEGGQTATALMVLREGDHIVWAEPQGGDDEGEGPEESGDDGTGDDADDAPGDDAPGDDAPSTTAAGDDADDTSTTSSTDTSAPTTSTTAPADAEEDAAGAPAGELTSVAADDGTDDADDPVSDADADTDTGSDADDAGGAEGGMPELFTTTLTVTAGDDDAELPEADGTITASDYEFDVDIPAEGGTINFRNDGPQQFHHAVLVDFGDNAAADVEEAFPVLLASEGDPSADPPDVGIDLSGVNFDFAGSGVFGPDGAAGTFEAELEDGNTYAVACFIQDRTGGPPHAIAYDMWDVFTAGGGTDGADDDATTTTAG